MNIYDKFEGIKEEMLQENEEKYGNQIRDLYGKQAVERSNQHFKNMSKEDFDKMTHLSNDILVTLEDAYHTKDPKSDLAKKCAILHKEWITICWGWYDKDAHLGLCNMYVENQEFKNYYDAKQDGLAEFLRDCVRVYLEENV